MVAKIDRTGDEKYNNFGSLMIIKEYRTKRDIDIYFPEYNWVFKHNNYANFKKGSVICPYERRCCNIGYIGDYQETIRDKKSYRIWYVRFFFLVFLFVL